MRFQKHFDGISSAFLKTFSDHRCPIMMTAPTVVACVRLQCLVVCVMCALCVLCVTADSAATFTIFPTGDSQNTINDADTVTTPPTRRLKILVHNPSIGWSHSQFVGAVADALVDAGHEVHLLGYSINSLVGNYTGSVKTQKLIWHERPAEKQNQLLTQETATQIFAGPSHGIWTGMLTHFLGTQAAACQEILGNAELLAYLLAEHYDFGLSEAYSPCPFGVFKLVGVKATASANAIAVHSLITSVYGVPSLSSFVYDLFGSVFTDPLKMNFVQRATNLFFDIYTYISLRDLNFEKEQAIFDEALGDERSPSLRDVMRNVSLAFVNIKEFFALPRPLSHKIVYIGGIAETAKKAKKPLPEPFASIIDAAPKGAVLFSFGTIADTKIMSAALKKTFADAFAKFPDHAFIWKLSLATNETLALPPNVHIFDWVPQALILEDPRTRLFISHCGLNSANEAATVGVPVLGIPLFGDQAYNAATIVNKGFGLALDIREIARSGRAFEATLHSLLDDAHFVERARLVARKLALTPFSAHERLVKWVEFAAEFENLNELNMPTENELGFFAYYSLDVIGSALGLLIFAGYLLTRFLKSLANYFSQIPKQKSL